MRGILGFLLFASSAGCASRESASDDPPHRDDLPTGAARNLLLEARTKAGLIEDAYLRSLVLATIAENQVEAGDGDQAVETVRLMPHSYVRGYSFVRVARGLNRIGQRDRARQLLDGAMRAGGEVDIDDLRSDIGAKVAIMLAELGEIDRAIEMASGLRGFGDPDVDALQGIALHLAMQGDLAHAKETLQRVKSAKPGWKDQMVAHAVGELCKRGRRAEALVLAKEISDPEVGGPALLEMAKDAATRGDTETLHQVVAVIPPGRERVLALRLIGQVDEAVQEALRIPDGCTRVELFNELAVVLAKSGRRPVCVELGAKAEKELAREGRAEYREWMTICTACILAAGGEIRSAERLLDGLKSRSIESGRWQVALTLARTGDVEEAERIVNLCTSIYFRCELRRERAELELAVGNRAEAVRLFAEAFRLATDPEYEWPETGTHRLMDEHERILVRIMDGQAESGAYKAALAAARQLQREQGEFYGAHTLRRLAGWFSQGGQLNRAREWIREIESPLQHALALAGLAEGMLGMRRRLPKTWPSPLSDDYWLLEAR